MKLETRILAYQYLDRSGLECIQQDAALMASTLAMRQEDAQTCIDAWQLSKPAGLQWNTIDTTLLQRADRDHAAWLQPMSVQPEPPITRLQRCKSGLGAAQALYSGADGYKSKHYARLVAYWQKELDKELRNVKNTQG